MTKARKKPKPEERKFVPMNEREIVALIAYMQRLGTDIKVKDIKIKVMFEQIKHNMND
jgi:cytochrome c oxidase cbb3-type subunit I/II